MHSYQCVQSLRVFRQCLQLLTCSQMLMHAIAHGGCTDTVRETALEVNSWTTVSCRTVHSNPRHCSLRRAFQPDAVPTEPSLPFPVSDVLPC